MLDNKQKVVIGVVLILHTVGLFGLNIAKYASFFQSLIPVNILITTIAVFVFHKPYSIRFICVALAIISLGFISEVIGIHSGILFGSYSYISNLGIQVADVPLILGLNWLLLSYCSRLISIKFSSRLIYQVIIGSSLMVVVDIFIEPFAIRNNMWLWTDGQIPLKNYVSWFFVSLSFQFLLSLCKIQFNPIGVIAYIVMLVFFFINMLLS